MWIKFENLEGFWGCLCLGVAFELFKNETLDEKKILSQQQKVHTKNESFFFCSPTKWHQNKNHFFQPKRLLCCNESRFPQTLTPKRGKWCKCHASYPFSVHASLEVSSEANEWFADSADATNSFCVKHSSAPLLTSSATWAENELSQCSTLFFVALDVVFREKPWHLEHGHFEWHETCFLFWCHFVGLQKKSRAFVVKKTRADVTIKPSKIRPSNTSQLK